MDEFEGNPTNQKEGYDRIILKNCFIVFTDQHVITYRLIIERYKKGAVGDITFSKFKRDRAMKYMLMQIQILKRLLPRQIFHITGRKETLN